ncbi:hypothetical protein NQ318_014147 [Aromia moschata]|uniref:BCD1 alpha/beta domain-containing protein n=1 Tax=Aromia moschata TaxID=1265417 RepID=A0AAV8XAF1_9CUCU|nr:hypothetical protein NQ318_014147 [Aromia moschata]
MDLKLHDIKVAESTKLSAAFSKYLVEQCNESLQESVQFYQAAGISGIRFLLKAEQKRGKFYELDPTSSLRECLEKKLIIEYPTIHVVLKDHACGYDIIDSDDEECEESNKRVKLGNEIVQKIVTDAEKDEKSHNSLKNLLFASDYSDDELLSD